MTRLAVADNGLMSAFDDDIRLTPIDGSTTFEGQVQPDWNIGNNPNGGYLLALAAQALRQRTPTHPDALSVTVHYLRPGLPGQPCRIHTDLLRSGRQLSTLRATLEQDGETRLELLAAMGDLGQPAAAPRLSLPMPEMPPPEACLPRSAPAQGVELPILQRLDIRLHPDEAKPGGAGRARITGWIRFSDGRAPDALACLLLADAFPPAVFGLLGLVGWVLGQFWSHDLADGRIIEDGALWDADGHLVAQSRQLALVRQG